MLYVQVQCLGMQTGYSHYVPDDAGAITAGRDTLFVVALDFDTSDRGFVLFQGLQQPMTMWLQLPNTHLQQMDPNSLLVCCFVFSFDENTEHHTHAFFLNNYHLSSNPSFTLFITVMYTDLPLSPSTDDPLAVPGAGDGCHTHFVRVVNDEHGPTTFWRKHADLAIIPR